jgi:hypothetical protein
LKEFMRECVNLHKSLFLGAVLVGLSACANSPLQQFFESHSKVANRVRVLKSTDLHGPLRGFGVDSQGQGAIMWSQSSNDTLSHQGRYIKDYLPDKSFSTNVTGSLAGYFTHHAFSKEKSVFIGSVLPVGRTSTFPVYNGSLLSLLLPNMEDKISSKNVGLYQILNITRKSQGKVSLLLCREYYSAPDGLSQPAVFVLDLSESEDLSAVSPRLVKEFANMRGPIFIGGSLDFNGNGLILWRKEEQVYFQRFTNFKPVDNEQKLEVGLQDSKENLFMQISDGSGYIAWPGEDGLQILPIKENLIQASLKKELKLPVKVNYVDQPSQNGAARSWDLQMSPQGQGMAVWVTSDFKQAYYQKIEDFRFVGTPQAIPNSTDGLQFGMLRLSANPEGPKIVAGLDTSCKSSFRTLGCQVDLAGPKEIWLSNPLL